MQYQVGQTLTPQQTQALLSGSNPATPAPQQSSTGYQVGQTLTPAQTQALLSGNPIAPVTPPPAPNPVADVAGDIGTGIVKGIGNFASQAYTALKQQASSAFNSLQGDIEPEAAGLSGQTPQAITPANVEQAAYATGKATIGTVVDFGKLVLAATGLTPVLSTSINNIADATSDVPAVQGVATSAPVSGALDVVNHAQQAIQDWATQHPKAYSTLSNIINVAQLAAGGEAASADLAETGEDMSAMGKAMTPDSTPITVHDTEGNTIPTTPVQAISTAEKEWQSPSQFPGTRFKAAKTIASNNPDLNIPQFLAAHGVSAGDNIDEQFYDTTQTAQGLINAAGEISSLQLRPGLQAADATGSIAPTPISDIQADAVKMLGDTPQITADDEEAISATIASKLAALARKYPDGLTLTNMHDEKIKYASNGGYSEVKSNADNNNAIANRTIGSTLADMVEAKAPPELNVDGVNKELSSYYKAADYLEALNGKKAPVPPITQAIRYGARIAGAAIGSHIPGGNLVSDFVGYQVAKWAEMQAENMLAPQRAAMLDQLKLNNPSAFSQVQDYLAAHPLPQK
jgi:hypothetical protein